MENKLILEIVTPHGLVLSEEVDEVVCTGSEGEFGVLPGHVPFFTTLKIGMLAYKKGTAARYAFVNWGYAEVGPDKVLVLADSAEKSEGIDVERAKAAMKRAEERLKKAEEIDFARATSSLERSVTRVQIAEKRS
ncbi:MAG: ATP synthase F1 subunit epsilon [Nitrospirae bacterium CG_4_10_14_0_8_um_filter_41_23]|nr:F0F1 ATP synthase subunit epsilon [Nitrospirota bacterium]OIP60355.1 MAG: ATP synthase F1 subunit epsilon [Nitrospirae bacterium CG2_30_41_42]PIQ94938.1 MAG: ATP synthase F1 subunit epsilon [Nitrospirae bacterium CG11_big_fil_rev_8_21_14_0_20_41_14]PIY85972.1 MAG: ATP synthase F1 subunit epsilon [Nitrospirae bacterium CG_4_10_14_0_8_um_filter_41_23]PJA80476.1 MAG: ATP synthase F1 subunit epsilon [Nitrospirae bacterium CG_4_9_14_3_um_filter_41_27]